MAILTKRFPADETKSGDQNNLLHGVRF
jgi:hypothetical protein